VLVGSPGLIGLSSLRPVAPPLPWFDLPEAGAAPGVGVVRAEGGGGRGVVVVCSVGVDLDLVPTAADCRLLYGHGEDELWLVIPEGDDLPVTHTLASWLDPPARVVTVPKGWEAAG
jgi:hypothetical protein